MYQYEDIARKRLTIHSTSGPEALALCPFHEDNNPSFRFNMKRGVWICYSCGNKGGIERFFHLLGATYVEPPVSLEVLSMQVAFLDMTMKNKDFPKPARFLPEMALQRFSFPHSAWAQRGYDGPTVTRWGLGYDPVSDRLTVPLRDLYGRLQGVAYRRLDQIRHGKYVYPKNFPKKSNMFGSWVVRELKPEKIVLVEGPTDAIRVWQAGIPAMAIYGSYFTSGHIRLLHRLNIKSVVCFYDNDDSGRKALQVTREVLDEALLSSVDWSGHKSGTDPGNLSLEEIRVLYYGAK